MKFTLIKTEARFKKPGRFVKGLVMPHCPHINNKI